MPARPIYVTIIGWLLVVIGVLSLLSTPAVLFLDSAGAWLDASRLPLSAQVALNLASALVSLVSGYFILRGRNWARLLFVLWSSAETALSVILSPAMATSGVFLAWIGLLILVMVLLFSPPSNRFFGSGETLQSDDEIPVV